MHSVRLSQWRRGCQCKHPEAATCSGGRERRARPCRPFVARGRGTKVHLERTAPRWPSAAWPPRVPWICRGQSSALAGLLPLISLEGLQVAIAIAGRVGGVGGSQGQLHLESEDWEGLAGRGVAASCAGSWRTWGCPGEVCVFVMPGLPRGASPPFPSLVASPLPGWWRPLGARGNMSSRPAEGVGIDRGGGCALCWRISKVGLGEAGEATIYIGLCRGSGCQLGQGRGLCVG